MTQPGGDNLGVLNYHLNPQIPLNYFVDSKSILKLFLQRNIDIALSIIVDYNRVKMSAI